MIVIKIKKAAMFGLDARIALAIFGALSVISGAALYSAIQNAKVTADITQVNNFAKAIEQYYLDIGEVPSLSDHVPNADLEVTDLTADNGIKGWNGPYISVPLTDNENYFNYKGITVAIVYGRSQDWSTGRSCEQSHANCSIYIAFLGQSTSNKVDKYEEILDGANTDLTDGNFRVNGTHIFFKTSIPFPPSKSSNS